MQTRNVIVICATLVVLAAVFWPGLYRYDRLGEGPSSLPARTSRITGAVEFLTPEGWQTLGFETPRDLAPLPADEVAKITGTGQFKYGKAFDVKLYNGSSWDVYEVEYEISAEGAKVQGPGENPFMCIGKQWTRRFRERTKLESLSSAVDYFDVGGSVESCAASWRVIGAHGVVARR